MKRSLNLVWAAMLAFSCIFAQDAPVVRKDKYDDPRLNTPVPFTLGDRDRLHTVEIKIEAIEKLIEAVNQRIDDINRRIDDTNRRIDDTNRELGKTNERILWMFGILVTLGGGLFAYVNTKFDKKFERLEEKFDKKFERLEEKFDKKFDLIVERLNSIDLKLERLGAKVEDLEKRQDRIEAEVFTAR